MNPMKEIEAKTLPTDVYLSFVTSLFGNRGTLFTGMVVHILSCVLISSNTGSLFYLLLVAVFISVFGYRLYWFHRFDRLDKASLTRAEIEVWEVRYVYGAATTALILGVASGYAVLVLQNMLAAFLWIAVTMASMVSIVGRNYGSRLAVELQTLGCCVPIILGCLLTGDIYLMIMSLFLIPFGLTTQSMAAGVREFFYENVKASQEVTLLAGRLDTALATMAHGLVMLDGEGRVQVANRRAYELLGLDAGKDIKDNAFVSVLEESARLPSAAILTKIGQLADGRLHRALLSFGDRLHMEFSASPRSDGGVVLIFEDVSARVAAEEKILHMVRFDDLTGLPNRGHFATLAAEKVRGRGEALAALAVFDVDGFKHVNDMRGHVVGDRLLAAIATRLSSLESDRLLAGRLIGDEFVLLLLGDEDSFELETQIRDVHAKIQGDYQIEGIRLAVSMNSGCAILPSQDFDMQNWQIKADLALNDAKSKGNGTLTVFRSEMDAQYIEEQRLRADLRLAVENRGLHVLYQPMYRPDGSAIECSEALVRWRHPERGVVGPNIFIPMAEDMGLVSHITRFVIDQACRDCAAWPEPMAVSVNLSIQDLRNDEIVGYVADVLKRHSLDPSRLHLEVTESCFMDEPVAVSAILNQFRATGVTIAIDDFGTGFSSLSYLDSLPLDVVKIDRAFIRNIGEDQRKLKLLRGTVHLSRELGLKIVVEGVETREQLALINRHRLADLVQGYVFSTPVGADRIGELAAESAGKLSAARRGPKSSQNPPLTAIVR
ncbi:PAS domain S-box-containing protein/diguanylate cyclase (GGDEF) domain-containing protein [Xaviernesmea oryzae]|uniref:PAS domain S-box-containing protein/diguanylate cyclase (GGDEF) domain-containing protein n=2 Tax=Xaviernesmea oryzae TaxID=464029 RepID=A0A1X7D0F4_9HYPH|nr:PAS domain S-box-containing protein/diguanylate cyclase (GGDEF) domain-containing protein [Xaviernesmea oryzae]